MPHASRCITQYDVVHHPGRAQRAAIAAAARQIVAVYDGVVFNDDDEGDEIWLGNELADRLDLLGIAYLATLVNVVPNTAHRANAMPQEIGRQLVADFAIPIPADKLVEGDDSPVCTNVEIWWNMACTWETSKHSETSYQI